MGSEGSLNWNYIPYKDNNHSLRQGIYIIDGDLRDYGSDEDIDKIVNWIKDIDKKLKAENHDMRQLAMNIEVEGKPSVILGLKYDDSYNYEIVKYEVVKNGRLLYSKD
jgi:hypothetical protein